MSAQHLHGDRVDVGGDIEVAGLTDTGRVRRDNQDRWLAFPSADPGGCVLIVADGMGGEADGGVAATIAVEAAASVLRASPHPATDLDQAVAVADEEVAQHRLRIGSAMCGTTLVIAVATPERFTVANVGDSRAYLVRDGSGTPITVDHSWVADEVRADRLPTGSERRHPRRNLVTRAVTGDGAAPDLFSGELRGNDVLLLCTDGVWEPVEDDRIGEMLSAQAAVTELVAELCTTALDNGGTDNVTAVICRVHSEDAG